MCEAAPSGRVRQFNVKCCYTTFHTKEEADEHLISAHKGRTKPVPVPVSEAIENSEPKAAAKKRKLPDKGTNVIKKRKRTIICPSCGVDTFNYHKELREHVQQVHSVPIAEPIPEDFGTEEGKI